MTPLGAMVLTRGLRGIVSTVSEKVEALSDSVSHEDRDRAAKAVRGIRENADILIDIVEKNFNIPESL